MLTYMDRLLNTCKVTSKYYGFNLCLVNPCNPNPCHNSGRCSISYDKAKCSCRDGYIGKLCDGKTSKLIEQSLDFFKYFNSYISYSSLSWIFFIKTNPYFFLPLAPCFFILRHIRPGLFDNTPSSSFLFSKLITVFHHKIKLFLLMFVTNL